MLTDTAAEAVYASTYRRHCPLALCRACAGGDGRRYVRNLDQEPNARTLAIRPWSRAQRTSCEICSILRARVPAGGSAPGWTVDAVRTKQTLALLATNLKLTLGPSIADRDEIAVLNAGLREVVVALPGGVRRVSPTLATQHTGAAPTSR